MSKKKGLKKERNKQYDKKLSIDGTLDEVLKVSIPHTKDKPKN